jgi:Double-stranded DNA deaminase toxin A
MSGALERLNAQLVNAADAVPGEELAAAKARVDELTAVFDEATSGSQNPDVVAALARLPHASATLAAALGRAHQVVTALAAFTNQLQLDHPIRRTLPQPTPAPTGTRGPALHPPPESQAPPVPAPYHPGFLESLPVRQRDEDPTDGVLTTVAGKKISAIASGWTGPGRGGPRLRRPWKNMMTATDHVEGHAAAIMRDDSEGPPIREAVLYVNNPPCPNIPWGCDRVLSDLLPVGSRLTVYGPDGFVKVYEGNGKGLA